MYYLSTFDIKSLKTPLNGLYACVHIAYMKYNTLNTIIDDIMLEMRRNNITESESYSRKQIEQWIIQYRSFILKELSNAKLPISYNYYQRFKTDLVQSNKDAGAGVNIGRTEFVSKDAIPEFFNNNFGDRFIASMDLFGNEIQIMSERRSAINSKSRHFYAGKPSAYIGRDSKYHMNDSVNLSTIEIQLIAIDPTEVPGFDYNNSMYPMDPSELPRLKQLIFQGELKFNLVPDTENDGREKVAVATK